MKKIYFTIILLLVGQNLAIAYENELKQLSTKLAESIAKSGKKSVAVMDFSDLQGNVTDGGRFLAEEFTVNLAESDKGFKVIERSRLSTILVEHKLASTGIIDPNTAKKLGQIAGVDSIVTGIVTPLGENVRLSVKVLAVDTAEIIGAASGDIQISKPLQELFGKKQIQLQSPSEPNSQNPSESPPTLPIKRIEVKDYVFELKGCTLSGDKVICQVLITNRSSDVELNMFFAAYDYKYCRIIDDAGNEYKVVKMGLGSSSGEYDRHPYKISSILVSGVPTRAVFLFSGISQNVKGLSLFEIGCGDGRNKVFVVQFRNIPLTKEQVSQQAEQDNQQAKQANQQSDYNTSPQSRQKEPIRVNFRGPIRVNFNKK